MSLRSDIWFSAFDFLIGNRDQPLTTGTLDRYAAWFPPGYEFSAVTANIFFRLLWELLPIRRLLV